MRTSGGRRRLIALLLSAGLLLWVVAPIATVLRINRAASTERLATADPAWVPVRGNVDLTRSPVDVALEWSPPPVLVAPAWAPVDATAEGGGALLSEVLVHDGQPVRNGDPLVVVSGVTRIGYASRRPFERELGQGDDGADVAELNTMLGVLGFAHGPSDRFGSATSEGVADMAASLGIATRTHTFDPGWVIFMPRASLEVAQVTLTVGAPAPSPGTEMIVGTEDLAAARLIQAGTAVETAPTGSTNAAGSDDEGNPAGPSAAAPVTGAPAVAPQGAVLTVAGEPVALTPERDAVSAEGIAALRSIVQSGSSVAGGQLERAAEPGELVLPSASVFAVADGATCVLRRHRDGKRSVPVTVVGGDLGIVVIRSAGLAPGDRVAVAPPAEDRECASS